MRRRVYLTLILCVALIAPNCGYGRRKDQAQKVVRAASRVRISATAAGTLLLSTVVQLPESVQQAAQQGQQIPGLQQAQQAQTSSFAVAVDFVHNRAVLGAAPVAEQPLAIYDRSRLLLHRSGKGTERRPWASLDFDKLNPRDTRKESNPPAGFLAFSPTVLVEMIAGALSGSVKKLGVDTIGGAAADHYAANFDWDKMTRAPDREAAGLKKLTDRRFDSLSRAFESMQIRKTVWPGEIWLDANGLPKRLKLVIEQRFRVEGQSANRNRRSRTETTVILDLPQYSVPFDLNLPTREQAIFVDGYAQLVREASRGLPQQAQPSTAQGASNAPVPGAPAQAPPVQPPAGVTPQ